MKTIRLYGKFKELGHGDNVKIEDDKLVWRIAALQTELDNKYTKTLSLAQFILESKDEYNQHKQHSFRKLPLSQGQQLCKELEQYTEEKYSFVCEVYTDGSYSIMQKDFWSVNEHKDGHTDRLILSVDDGGED